jgi:hypothetical protein
MLKTSLVAVVIASSAIAPAFADCGNADRVYIDNGGGYTARLRVACEIARANPPRWVSDETGDVMLGQGIEIAIPLGPFMTQREGSTCWIIINARGGTTRGSADGANFTWTSPVDTKVDGKWIRKGSIAKYLTSGGTQNPGASCSTQAYEGPGTGPVGTR